MRVEELLTTLGPATERAVHTQLCRIEYEMVATARAAPGVRAAVAAMAAAGTRVTVISSLASAASPAPMTAVTDVLDDEAQRLPGDAGRGCGPGVCFPYIARARYMGSAPHCRG